MKSLGSLHTYTHALKKREEGQKEHRLAGLWPNMPGALQ